MINPNQVHPGRIKDFNRAVFEDMATNHAITIGAADQSKSIVLFFIDPRLSGRLGNTEVFEGPKLTYEYCVLGQMSFLTLMHQDLEKYDKHLVFNKIVF